jgi:CheY-like chemotaxis protein
MEPKNKHVLIIDNDETTRRLFGSLLSTAGYEVIYAKDGEIGRETARRLQPDLILMDESMPGWDGLETSNILKKEPQTTNIPIILFTNADLSIEAVKWMKEIGVMDYIQKGVSNDEFIIRINKIFEKLENTSSPKEKVE